MNQMPGMPQMPSIKPSSDESEINSESLSSPFAEDSASAESDVNLELSKPKIEDLKDNSNSEVKIPLAPKKGIEVVATRSGFYNQNRIKEGVKFFIKSEEQFGDWMRCVDPYFEKKRLEFYKNKKAKK